jgi:hypothetical protein
MPVLATKPVFFTEFSSTFNTIIHDKSHFALLISICTVVCITKQATGSNASHHPSQIQNLKLLTSHFEHTRQTAWKDGAIKRKLLRLPKYKN